MFKLCSVILTAPVKKKARYSTRSTSTSAPAASISTDLVEDDVSCAISSDPIEVEVSGVYPAATVSTDPVEADISDADPTATVSTHPVDVDVSGADPAATVSTDPVEVEVSAADLAAAVSTDQVEAEVSGADLAATVSTVPVEVDFSGADPAATVSTDPVEVEVSAADLAAAVSTDQVEVEVSGADLVATVSTVPVEVEVSGADLAATMSTVDFFCDETVNVQCVSVLPNLDGYVQLVVSTADLPPTFPRPESDSVTLLVPGSMVVPIEESSGVCEVTNANVKTRKRKRESSLHKASLRKQLRNSGKEYKSKDGTQRPSRMMGSCSCRMHCFSKVSEGQCEKLFDSFWDLGDFDKQNAFIFGHIKCFEPKRRRVEDPADSRKQNSFAFYVKNESGTDIRVCKQAFLGIFGLQNSRGRVNNIMTHITSGSGVPKIDGRGRHHNRTNKSPQEVVECVKAHIASFPQYQSHYSRRYNINRSYLGPELSIAKMHELYCSNSNWPAASAALYRRIFCEHFNLGFATPKTDTCKKCEATATKLKTLSPDSSEHMQLNDDWTRHREQAEKAFDLLRSDAAYAKEHPTEQYTIALDLQQALPTPKLNVGPAFYKRKIMTYNVAVHDCDTNDACMMLWPETIAGRGADEIASCLFKYCQLADIKAKRLVIYSDNCAGQNKNLRMVSLYLYLLCTGQFDEIRHHFPISGHTMLPCDRDFGVIERSLRRRPTIYTPAQYAQAIRESKRVKPFKVVEMEQQDFLCFDPVMAHLTKRSVTTAGEKVSFRDAAQIMVRKDAPMILHLKQSHDSNEQWQLISLQKRGRPKNLANTPPMQKHSEARSLPKNKVADVKSLLDYIPPVYHSFFDDIVVDKSRTESIEYLDDVVDADD